MRLLAAIPFLAAMLSLASCIVGGKNRAPKTPATPAAMVANAAAKPPVPPAPLSTPQTDIQLPPAQTLTPEALATIQVPEPPAPEPAPPAKPPAAKKQTPVAAAPRPEAPAPTIDTAPSTPAGPPAPSITPEEPPRLQPVYTEEEKRRILTELERRRIDTENLLRGIILNRVSADQRTAVERVRSFMNSAADALKRGDLHSADGSSMRALILARELVSGR